MDFAKELEQRTSITLGIQHDVSLTSAQPATTPRFEWTMGVYMVLLCLGSSLDNWAHFHGMVDQSFFTPWHAVLYGMMALLGVTLGTAALVNVRKGFAWQRSLPPGYRLSLLGVGLFLVSGIMDLCWHLVFGIEYDTAAYISPTHLFLLGSGILAGTGPVRSAWLRLRPSSTRGWSTLGPMLLSAASAVAALAMFTQFASPLVNTFAPKTALMVSSPVGIDMNGIEQAFGVAEVIVQTVLLMSILLLLLRTWKLPYGAVTLLIVLPSAVQAIMVDNYQLIAAVFVVGLIADVAANRLCPPLHGYQLYAIGCVVPAMYVGAIDLALWLTVGVGWPPTLVGGSIVYASATGLFVSFLLDWPLRYTPEV